MDFPAGDEDRMHRAAYGFCLSVCDHAECRGEPEAPGPAPWAEVRGPSRLVQPDPECATNPHFAIGYAFGTLKMAVDEQNWDFARVALAALALQTRTEV